jgi:hypothetical protein
LLAKRHSAGAECSGLIPAQQFARQAGFGMNRILRLDPALTGGQIPEGAGQIPEGVAFGAATARLARPRA